MLKIFVDYLEVTSCIFLLKMEVEAVQRFYEFFQDFLCLCLLENWPTVNSTNMEIKNAFVTAKHVENYVDRMKTRNILLEFIAALNEDKNYPPHLLKSCFLDPPKLLLMKIINSGSDIENLQIAFKVFIELFGENRLENSLTNIIVEKASIQALLSNIKDQ